MGRIETDRLYSIACNARSHLTDIHLEPGAVIWAVKSICDDCPRKGNNCTVGCASKDRKYLEKLTVFKVEIILKEGGYDVIIIDTEGARHPKDKLNESIFTDREEALKQL